MQVNFDLVYFPWVIEVVSGFRFCVSTEQFALSLSPFSLQHLLDDFLSDWLSNWVMRLSHSLSLCMRIQRNGEREKLYWERGREDLGQSDFQDKCWQLECTSWMPLRFTWSSHRCFATTSLPLSLSLYFPSLFLSFFIRYFLQWMSERIEKASNLPTRHTYRQHMTHERRSHRGSESKAKRTGTVDIGHLSRQYFNGTCE